MPSSPHFPPPRPWSPLSDLEWHALYPYLRHRSPAGRQVGDLRRRMDAIFHLASTPAPWREVPARYGKPDTIARYFRRLTRAGLWQKLLEDLTTLAPTHPLRQIELFICRACRRAYRIIGFRLVLFVRRLGMHTALNGPPWMLPDPDLSETLFRMALPAIAARDIPRIRLIRRILRTTAGRRHIPRWLRLAWS